MLNRRSSVLIDSMRFPLIVLVIFIHILPGYYMDVPREWTMNAAYIFISETLSHTFGRIAVPTFYIFSGYFFFYKLTPDYNLKDILLQIKKRITTVLIPYLLWNIMYIIIILFKNFIFSLIGSPGDDAMNILRTNSIFELFWSNTINYPLWYLRDLICMITLSPILYLLLTKVRGSYLVIIMYLIYIANWESNIPGFSSTALFYFILGGYLGYLKIDFVVQCYKAFKYFVPLMVFLAPIVTLLNNTIYYEHVVRLFIPIAIISFVGAFYMINNNIIRIFNKLSPAVLFIYGIHVIYIINWTKGVFVDYFSHSQSLTMLGYFIQPIIISIVCIILYRIFKKILPIPLSWLMGGRI